jgi:2,4-dienoyl-CoA reductase-like NADH-dependent reductase (Old Yellow Enzyme family)
MSELDVLWQPIEIGNVTLKNRVWVSAHDAGYSEDNILSDRYVAYLEERAKGGAGTVLPGVQIVHPSGSAAYGNGMDGWRPEVVEQYRKLSDAVHRHGTKVFLQIGHWGAEGDAGQLLDAQHELLAPSGIRSIVSGQEPRTIEANDIEAIIAGYVQTAANAQDGGVDGVEIHAGHGYLICQFLSPLTNQRTDEYGGSVENRCRFMLEVTRAIKERCGADFPIGTRISLDELMDLPGGITADEGEEVVRVLHASGLFSYFSVTGGNSHTVHKWIAPMTSESHANFVPLAARVKKLVDVPVITVGRITEITQAAEIVRRGDADIVAMTRAHIADPEIVSKASSGRVDEIRPCIGVNQGCLRRIARGQMISCTQNPVTGRESQWGAGSVTPAAVPKKVLVVGGGPSGLKSAELAARRGHEVVLIEQADALGGQLRYASRLPHRAEWAIMVRTLERAVARHGVDVRLNTEATVDLIEELGADEIVVATGSRFARTGFTPVRGDRATIPGLEDPLDPLEVIDDPERCGERVLIVDDKGDYVPLGLAEILVTAGHTVEIVSRHFFIGEGTLLTGDLMWAVPRLAAAGVKFTPQTLVEQVDGTEVTLLDMWTFTPRVQEADTVVLCMGKLPTVQLYKDLRLGGRSVHRIGDCVAPRGVDEASYEGEMVGRSV